MAGYGLVLLLLIYSLLLLPTLKRQGISWDEQTDIAIARSYLSQPLGWFVGSDADPSQTRLPMFVVALAYALSGQRDLITARLVSYGVGALTIIGTYVYSRRLYGARIALLACALLTTSPFFLSFARVAFTESDIFLACAFVWLSVCMAWLRGRATIGRAAVTAIVLGLAISSKFTAVAIFPAVLYEIIFNLDKDVQGEALYLSKADRRTALVLMALMAGFIVIGWIPPMLQPQVDYTARYHLAHYLWVAFGSVLLLIWGIQCRRYMVPRLLLAVFVIVIAGLTFFFVPPVHTTMPRLIGSLGQRFEHEMQWAPAFMAEAVILHLGCVIFKSGPVIGLWLLVSFVLTGRQWVKRNEARFLLLLALCYFIGLVALPIAQTFYMVPLLPPLAITAAVQGRRLLFKHRRVALFIGVSSIVLLVVDLAVCYPDYNLNGYQWLGVRYLGGRSTIGYRSIVQPPSDGVQQVMEWLNDNAGSGETALLYLNPWHIVRATSPNPAFKALHPDESTLFASPDFVVTHINYEIRHGWGPGNNPQGEVFWRPYRMDLLREKYTKVFSVERAFGIEVASIWRRNSP